MAITKTELLEGCRRRRLRDRAAKLAVTAGGVAVLCALVLIFIFLLYVTLPLFRAPEISVAGTFAPPVKGEVYSVGLDDDSHLGYAFTRSGDLAYFEVGADKPMKNAVWQLMESPVSFSGTLPSDRLYAYGGQRGEIQVVTPGFSAHYYNGSNTYRPKTLFPVGGEPVVIDEKARQVTALNVIPYNDGVMAVSQAGGNELLLTRIGTGGKVVSSFTVPGSERKPAELLLTPDGRQFYALYPNQLSVYQITAGGKHANLREVLPFDEGDRPDGMFLLAGANSLMLSFENGMIEQWFDVLRDGERLLTKVRTFTGNGTGDSGLHTDGGNITSAGEFYRKSFARWYPETKKLVLYATTSNSVDAFSLHYSEKAETMVFSPRADNLLLAGAKEWALIKVDNPHPEVSWDSLWEKVWYEGYPEPAYVWQSTSASDDFESKLSLIPITFGTLKVTLYTMLFAIPLAVGGAIYTAYFMPSSMRRVVKPTVEIMEALPTVIIGFLAGLWLAPLVEENLASVMLLVTFLPLFMILVGAAWPMVGRHVYGSVQGNWHAIILVPMILLFGYACFQLGPWIELHYLGGDARVYLTHELGISYDQRNALVVGVAMGFAVVPTIFSIAEDAIFSVPSHLSFGSLALGATQWQTLTKVILLTASPGIFSAIMMGIGRAVGETMIVLMATGNTPIMDWSFFEGLRTLSANIAVEMPESEVGSSHYRILFLAAFVLFVSTFVFNTLAEFIRQRLREKYSAL
ncbi:ABC transporter permease subunit [Parasalinivibrio latis]|uniref:ABC transporter permease subunit n=1 Tax=Parasalinivibrio latis TaxID=2952610 RepID=UPI0030DFD1DB